MKNFVCLITAGIGESIPDLLEKWTDWIHLVDDKIVEQIGLHNGKKVTQSSIEELEKDSQTITGYVMLKAKNIEEALKLVQKCPLHRSAYVFEVMERIA